MEFDSMSAPWGGGGSVSTGCDGNRMAITPNGSRLYVSSPTEITVVEPATQSIFARLPLPLGPASGIAITPGGDRAYFVARAGDYCVVGLDPALPGYRTVQPLGIGSLSGVRSGSLVFSPSGSHAVATLRDELPGATTFKVEVIDTDPASPTSQSLTGTPINGPETSTAPLGRIAMNFEGWAHVRDQNERLAVLLYRGIPPVPPIFSGPRVAAAAIGQNRMVFCRDLSTGNLSVCTHTHQGIGSRDFGPIGNALALSLDGSLLILTSQRTGVALQAR